MTFNENAFKELGHVFKLILTIIKMVSVNQLYEQKEMIKTSKKTIKMSNHKIKINLNDNRRSIK